MFKRQTTGSVVCASCGTRRRQRRSLLSLRASESGSWGFAPALRSLGQDLGFVPLVTGISTIAYVASLVMSVGNIGMSGFNFLARQLRAPQHRGERRGTGLRAESLVDGSLGRVAARQPAPHRPEHVLGAPAWSGVSSAGRAGWSLFIRRARSWDSWRARPRACFSGSCRRCCAASSRSARRRPSSGCSVPSSITDAGRIEVVLQAMTYP